MHSNIAPFNKFYTYTQTQVKLSRVEKQTYYQTHNTFKGVSAPVINQM